MSETAERTEYRLTESCSCRHRNQLHAFSALRPTGLLPHRARGRGR